MTRTVQVAATYRGETIGDRFADPGMAAIRREVAEMIKDAGLTNKLVALIIPNPFHEIARPPLNALSSQLVTIWGRAPQSDLVGVSKLLETAKSKYGSSFYASDRCRVEPDGDVVVSPAVLVAERASPPRAWGKR